MNELPQPPPQPDMPATPHAEQNTIWPTHGNSEIDFYSPQQHKDLFESHEPVEGSVEYLGTGGVSKVLDVIEALEAPKPKTPSLFAKVLGKLTIKNTAELHMEQPGYLSQEAVAKYIHGKIYNDEQQTNPDVFYNELTDYENTFKSNAMLPATHKAALGEQPAVADGEAVEPASLYLSTNFGKSEHAEDAHTNSGVGEVIAEKTAPAAERPLRPKPEPVPYVERVDGKEHFVKVAPRFAEQVTDETRTNTFKYVKSEIMGQGTGVKIGDTTVEVVDVPEHDGLVALQSFLLKAVEVLSRGNHDHRSVEIAQGMLENLTFIGKKEYDEAAKGLGEMWKEYLDADPRNQLCVPLAITQSYSAVKSDTYLFENIILTFTEEELERYNGRIINNTNKLSEDPEHVKVVLLDDWTISGAQMRRAYSDVVTNNRKYINSVEVHLMVASQARLKRGLAAQPYFVGTGYVDVKLPIRAYYKAHAAKMANSSKVDGEDGAHITGTHSSVDYDFEESLSHIIYRMDLAEEQKNNSEESNLASDAKLKELPPLANIVRPYRGAKPRVVIDEQSGRIRKTSSKEQVAA